MNPLELIAEERKRQREVEGWTHDHDDGHETGQMAMAAACYAADRPIYKKHCDLEMYFDAWPWDSQWDKRKKHTRMKQLTIAGALIVAEMERLQRLCDEMDRVEDERIERLAKAFSDERGENAAHELVSVLKDLIALTRSP